MKELPALKGKNLKQRQSRNDSQAYENQTTKKERFSNMDDILAYLKHRVEEKQRNQK
jgi:hypothetical protein